MDTDQAGPGGGAAYQNDSETGYEGNPDPSFQYPYFPSYIGHPEVQNFNYGDGWSFPLGVGVMGGAWDNAAMQQPMQMPQFDGSSDQPPFAPPAGGYPLNNYSIPNLYGNSLPPSFPGSAEYAPQPSFQGNAFVNTVPASQGATVAPSALESNSAVDRPLPAQAETPIRKNSISNSRGPAAASNTAISSSQSKTTGIKQSCKEFAARIPLAREQNGVFVLDAAEVAAATNAVKLTEFLMVTKDTYHFDAGKAPTLAERPNRSSKKALRDKVIASQAGRPWQPSQATLLHKLNITNPFTSIPKSTISSSGRPRTGTQSTAAESVDISSEEESDDEEEDSEEEDQMEKSETSPLPAKRPTNDRNKEIEYDAIKATWFKRNTELSADTIRGALGEIWDIVKGLRESIKKQNFVLQKLGSDEVQSAEAKARLEELQQTMENVMALVAKHGHPEIVKRFGDIDPLMASFYALLADKVKSDSYESPIVENILKLLVGANTLTTERLEKFKLDRIFKFVLKKGNDKLKNLTNDILNQAARNTKPKAGDSNKEKTAADSPSKSEAQAPQLDAVAAAKRGRASEGVSTPPVKKQLPSASNKPTPTTSKQGLSAATKSVTAAKSSAPVKATIKSEVKKGPGASVPGVKKIVPKQPSILSGLVSASKKPGTSKAEQEAAAVTQAKNKPVGNQSLETKAAAKPVASVPPPRTGFSLADTLAQIANPKVEEKKTVIENRPPETDEEKKKRLRKEERRKLRVSWKPEESLREIKIFHHYLEEDLGYDENMKRDVADVRSEGRMLKAHKDQEVDDDDDEEPKTPASLVEEFRPWKSPSLIDFSDTDYDVTVQNIETRGAGTVQVNSPEKEIQEQRERRTLVQIYDANNPIPPSPREPLEQDPGPVVPPVAFGSPPEFIRAREREFLAAQGQGQMQGQQQTRGDPRLQVQAPVRNQAPVYTQPQMQPQFQPQMQPQMQSQMLPQVQHQPQGPAQSSSAPAKRVPTIAETYARMLGPEFQGPQWWTTPPPMEVHSGLTDLEKVFAQHAHSTIRVPTPPPRAPPVPVQQPVVQPPVVQQPVVQQPAVQQPYVMDPSIRRALDIFNAQSKQQQQPGQQYQAPPPARPKEKPDLTKILKKFEAQGSISLSAPAASQNNNGGYAPYYPAQPSSSNAGSVAGPAASHSNSGGYDSYYPTQPSKTGPAALQNNNGGYTPYYPTQPSSSSNAGPSTAPTASQNNNNSGGYAPYYPTQPSSSSNAGSNNSHERKRGHTSDEGNEDNNTKRSRGGHDHKKGGRSGGVGDGGSGGGTGSNSDQPPKKGWNGVPFVQCQFWHKGSCRKGANCTFRHDKDARK